MTINKPSRRTASFGSGTPMKIAEKVPVVSFGVLLLLASRDSAQNYVTPTVKSTPPGQLIVVNNGVGDQVDPHVDGDLVCYYDQQDGAATTIRYFNLTT